MYLTIYLLTCAALFMHICLGFTPNLAQPYYSYIKKHNISCKPIKIIGTSWRTKLNLIDKYVSYNTDCKPMHCSNLSWPSLPNKHVLSPWFGDLYFDTNQPFSTRLCLPNLINFEANIPVLHNTKRGLFHKLSNNNFQQNHISLNQDIECKMDFCKNGGICHLNKCQCLLHFRGQYCTQPINYCLSNPCRFGSTCTSVLGGFFCICLPNHIGINCHDILSQDKIIKSILNPNVIYSPLQYVGVDSFVGIYARSLGTRFKLYLNLNNETKELVLARSFQYYVNGRSALLKYFFPPIHEVSGSIYLFRHKLTFKQEGIFNFTIATKNAQHLTLKSNYEIRVIKCVCTLFVSIDNQVYSEKSITPTIEFRKRDQIYFKSNVNSNCIHVKLLFHWSLQYVSGNKTNINLRKGISFDLTYLVIPPYKLLEGRYCVILEVTMLLPIKLVTNHTRLFFNIYSEPLVAKIEGGDDIINNWEEPLVIDGSKSWNPNTKKNETQNFIYKWYCYIIDPEIYSHKHTINKVNRFCHGLGYILNITSPYLHIPERTLTLDFVYAFILHITVHRKLELPLSAETVQIVHIKSEMTPVLRLHCIHNCDSKFSNPNEVTEVEATCLSCNKSNNLENMHWVVSCTENDVKKDMSRIVEFSLLQGHLIVYEDSIKAGEQCKIQFEAEYSSKTGLQGFLGTVELLLFMNSVPSIGSCTVTPDIGYGILTDFSITCHNYEDTNLPILYEAAQFRIKQNSQGLIVAYGYFPEMHNITLCAGIVSNNFITTLRIIATNSYGLYSFTEVSVTVLPPKFIKNDAFLSLQKVKDIIAGEESQLGRLMTMNDYYKLCQKILSISVSLNDYLDSLDNTEPLITDINLIGNILMDYLNVAPIISIPDSKLIATGFFMILKLLKFDLQSYQYFCYTKIDFLNKIVESLRSHNRNIPFVDIQDLGILVLSISSMLFEYCRTTSRKVNRRRLVPLEVPIMADTLLQFSSLYFKKIVVNQRPHLITSQNNDLHLILQKGNPKHLARQLFFIPQYGSVKLVMRDPVFQQNIVLNTLLMYSYLNPFQIGKNISDFPFIRINVVNAKQQSIMSLPFVASLMYNNKSQNVMIPVKGNIYYHSNWAIQHKMHIIKVNVNMYGKFLITFFNIPENVRFLVIIKVNEKPILRHFQDEALIIPQDIDGSELDKNSILVSNNIETNSSVLYVGIIPVNKNSKDNEQWIEVKPNSDEIFTDEEGFLTIPYEVIILNVKCINWDILTKGWLEDCQVLAKSLYNTVTCFCPNQTTVTAKYTQLPLFTQQYTIPNDIYAKSNPFFVFEIAFCLIFYIFSFLFALNADRKSNSGRDIIVLDCKNVDFKYIYLIKLTTGMQYDMGTTSNILIQLEGDEDVSNCYNVTEETGGLQCGSEHWFAVREKQLGDIYCINFFSDYSGRNPLWYCEEIIVHDIQKHIIYLFKPKLWLNIGHGVNRLSFSVFTYTYSRLFIKIIRFKENIKHAIGLGYNRWLAMFYKHPSSNHTYVQRTVLAFFHLIITNFITIYLHKNYKNNEKESLRWEWSLVYVALLTTVISVVVCLIFSTTFMSIDSRTNPERAYKSVLQIKQDQNIRHTKTKVINLKEYFYSKFGNEFNLKIKLNGLQGNPVTLTRKYLPYGSLYVAWFLIIFFLLLFMYLSVLMSMDFGHIQTIESLICTFLSLGMSFILFEPLKLLIVAGYLTWHESNKIYIENRTNDVYRALYYKNKVKHKKQRYNMFKPMTHKMMDAIHKMKVEEQSYKDNLVNMCMYLMLFIILVCMIVTLMDKYSFHNSKSIYHVLFENSEMMEMRSINELYVNMAIYFLPIVHNFTGSTNVNHLIGVPRLRQLRKPTKKCTRYYESLQEWTKNCYQDCTYFSGDSENYGESWGKFDDLIKWKNSYPWKYNSEQPETRIRGNFTLYSGRGYIVNLGHNLVQSLQSLQYLVDTGWMDKQTQVVFMEFPLYNPQHNIISELIIIFEHSISGKFTTQGVSDSLVIHSFFTLKEINILATLIAFFLSFAIISIKEWKSAIHYLRRNTNLISQLFSFFFIIFGALILSFYLNNLLMSNYAVIQISKNNVGSYLYFHLNSFLAKPLLVFCTLMIILIVVKWWLVITHSSSICRTIIIFRGGIKNIIPLSIIFLIYVNSFAAASFVIMFTTFEFSSLYNAHKTCILLSLGLYRYTVLNLPNYSVTMFRILSAFLICGIIITFIVFLNSYFKSVFILNKKLKQYTALNFMSQSITKSEEIMGYLVQTKIFCVFGIKRKSSSYVCESIMRTIIIERIKYHIDGMKTARPIQNKNIFKPSNVTVALYRTMYRLDEKFAKVIQKFEDI